MFGVKKFCFLCTMKNIYCINTTVYLIAFYPADYLFSFVLIRVVRGKILHKSPPNIRFVVDRPKAVFEKLIPIYASNLVFCLLENEKI
jgi:hypothetical protein